MYVTVNIEALLEFFDLDREVRRHSSAIKGVSGEELCLAVLMKYLQERHEAVRFLEMPCKTRGARLDKWVEVQAANGRTFHYQVEVKSWSFHGYGGGEPLAVRCDEQELRDYKVRLWKGYWNADEGRFHTPQLDKVLKPMDADQQWEVRPLACLWAAMHPEGLTDPWFDVDGVKDSPFDSISVFSVSGYLRNHLRSKGSAITLALPDTAARLRHLDRLFELAMEATAA